ncbi:hypothetical protein ACEUAI_13355 [Aeromonas veronii]|uniref:hypothetical protein n=1 Tax=Aeromonas hydrophila TaxID=644 RepID=UPI002B4783DD|nr:hypothetical protein [Aeromonas hydrophila]
MNTLESAASIVDDAANNGTYLDERLRDAMRVAADATRQLSKDAAYISETQPLKDLITHMVIHSAYERNGYYKMTSDMKRLYDAINSSMGLEE